MKLTYNTVKSINLQKIFYLDLNKQQLICIWSHRCQMSESGKISRVHFMKSFLAANPAAQDWTQNSLNSRCLNIFQSSCRSQLFMRVGQTFNMLEVIGPKFTQLHASTILKWFSKKMLTRDIHQFFHGFRTIHLHINTPILWHRNIS